jgi:hypothetical protein
MAAFRRRKNAVLSAVGFVVSNMRRPPESAGGRFEWNVPVHGALRVNGWVLQEANLGNQGLP